jgi:hypothetical protein
MIADLPTKPAADYGGGDPLAELLRGRLVPAEPLRKICRKALNEPALATVQKVGWGN